MRGSARDQIACGGERLRKGCALRKLDGRRIRELRHPQRERLAARAADGKVIGVCTGKVDGRDRIFALAGNVELQDARQLLCDLGAGLPSRAG